MTTTTLRLPEPLKERIFDLAEQTGQTAHAFMLQAIEDRVRDEEVRQAFASEAQSRYDKAMASSVRSTGTRDARLSSPARGCRQGRQGQGATRARMARLVLSERVRDNFDRIFDHVFQYTPEAAVGRIEWIISALDILETSPLIGRPVQGGKRELVIRSGAAGLLRCIAT